MANKIPVGQTIGEAYRFAVRRFFAVLGATWVPLVLFWATTYLLFRNMTWPRHWGSASAAVDWGVTDSVTNALGGAVDPAANPVTAAPPVPISPEEAQFLSDIFRFMPLWELVFLACSVVLAVGVTRVALGVGRTPVAFFTLGRPFWRMLGANVLFYILMIVAEMAIFIPVAIVFGIGGAALKDMADTVTLGAAAIVVGAVAICAFYYVFFRLGFLIAPVVVAEEKIDLRRGWDLARGNVLRIVTIFFATVLPTMVVLEAVLIGIVYVVFPKPLAGNPFDPAMLSEHLAPVIAGAAVGVIATILFLGVFLSAPAFAYRSLVPARSDG